MNLIGARRPAAVFVRSTLWLVFSAYMMYAQGECDQSLSAQQRAENFKKIDEEAQNLIRRQEYSRAADLYRQAVCLIPDSPRAWYGLGTSQAGQSDFQAARESFKKADTLQSGTPMPLIMQIRVNTLMHDMDALKDALRDLAKRFPADQNAHEALSRFLAENNLFDLALAEALRVQPDDKQKLTSKLELAGLENTVGAYNDAAQTAVQVLAQEAAPPQLRASAAGIAGLSYESMGNKDEAISYLNKAISLDPKQENSYLALADLYDQLQRYSDAADVLTKARIHLANSTAILLPLGTYLIRSGRFVEGMRVVREVIHQTPETQDAYIRLAEGAHRAGDSLEELHALEQLSSRNPNYPMIDLLLARAMLSQSPPDYQGALAKLNLAEQKSPSDADVYLLEGRAYIATEQYEAAERSLKRSIELRPMDAAPYYQLARVLQKLGKSEEAREQFARVKHLEDKTQQ